MKPPSAGPPMVANCPAVSDHEARLVEITCPIDIKLRFFRDAQGNPSMAAIDGEQSSIRPQQFSQMVMAVHPSEWRHPQRPLIQVMTPLQTPLRISTLLGSSSGNNSGMRSVKV